MCFVNYHTIVPYSMPYSGNFRGSWFSNISQFVVYIFMVAAYSAGKGGRYKVASFVGKILPHKNYPCTVY